jgi:hypothetical protein
MERPHLHRVDGGLDRGVAGHEDHFGVGMGLAGVGQDGQPVRAGHLEVRQDDVDRVLVDDPEGLHPRPASWTTRVRAIEDVAEERKRNFLVLGDQEGFFHTLKSTQTRLPGKVSPPGR